jgi:hypothetical protein
MRTEGVRMALPVALIVAALSPVGSLVGAAAPSGIPPVVTPQQCIGGNGRVVLDRCQGGQFNGSLVR